MKIQLLLIYLLLPVMITGANANSVPTSYAGEGGAIVPVSRKDVRVISEHLLITFPPAGKENASATIRAEYILKPARGISAPLILDIGFPITSSSPFTPSESDKTETPAATAKRDGSPVKVRFLALEDLAQPAINSLRSQIDKALEKHPDLRKVVMAARAEGKVRGAGWLQEKGYEPVRNWLLKNGGKELREPDWRSYSVAQGLLGLTPWDDDNSFESLLEEALVWLNPSYKKVDITENLSRMWGAKKLLLDPEDNQVFTTDADTFLGVLQFRIELTPHKQQTLVIEYHQPLGMGGLSGLENREDFEFQGLRYIMANARKWRSWGNTSIEIRIPKGWGRVATRPHSSLTRDKQGMRIYRIQMGRPVEDLYVSAKSKPSRSIN